VNLTPFPWPVRIDAGFNNNLSYWLNGDCDLNGSVNFDDYVLIDLAYNAQNGTLANAHDYLNGGAYPGIPSAGLQKVHDHWLDMGADYKQHLLDLIGS
jgi:hypothetical protein